MALTDDTLRLIVGIIILVLFGAFLSVLVLFGPNSKVSEVMLGSILGYLANLATSVVNYYFGSSSGSNSKSATIATMATTAASK